VIRWSAVQASELARWAISGAVVVFAHASAAAIIANWTDPIMPSETAGAITVDLAPLAVAPADAQDDVAPGPQMTRAETPPERKPDDKVEDKPAVQTVTEQKLVAEEKTEPKRIDEPQVTPAPLAPDPEVTAALPPPKPQPRHAKPKPARPPAPATTAPQRAPRIAALTAAPAQGEITGSANAMQTWKGQILAAVKRNMRYPAEAQARREQGTPEVWFRIDRSGRLLASRLQSASGHAALDQEALAIIKRAQPFPPAPAGIVDTYVDVTVPLRFFER
jgi:protein TonB